MEIPEVPMGGFTITPIKRRKKMTFHCIFNEFTKGKANFLRKQKFFKREKIRFHFDKFNKNTMKRHILFSPLNFVYLPQKYKKPFSPITAASSAQGIMGNRETPHKTVGCV